MRKTIAATAVAFALAVTATPASAYVEHPYIGEYAAFTDSQHYLAGNFPGWRHRKAGYIDCRQGRIKGYIWSCAVGWYRGYNCRFGRVRIENEYAEAGTTYYKVNFGYQRC
jgi:hypothetical protein